MSETTPEKTEGNDEKTPWNIKLSGIIFQAVAGGAIAPIGFAIAEPRWKKWQLGTTGKLLTIILGFKPKYLEALQTYYYALEVEGFRGNLPPLALVDVMIPLRLHTDRRNVYGQAKIHKTIWHFLTKVGSEEKSQQARLVIVADPGYGKTTLTRYLALSYSCPTYTKKGAAKRLPVLLRFRESEFL